jgi:hypothetical protein
MEQTTIGLGYALSPPKTVDMQDSRQEPVTDMPNAQPTTILNTTLPPNFRQIRIELAREPEHPTGESGIAYLIIAPLDADDRIDEEQWRQHREACRVIRLRPGKDSDFGHLVHYRGGSWAFQYNTARNILEVGYHFADEHFVVGEYVSINEEGVMHPFRVVSVSRL